jgi:hypothetical protein
MADSTTRKLKSGAGIFMDANGDTDVSVTGPSGTLTLQLSPDGPTIAIKDPERTQRLGGAEKYKALVTLKANGHLRGWCLEKKGATTRDDTLVWFPAKKQRATAKKKAKA